MPGFHVICITNKLNKQTKPQQGKSRNISEAALRKAGPRSLIKTNDEKAFKDQAVGGGRKATEGMAAAITLSIASNRQNIVSAKQVYLCEKGQPTAEAAAQ